MVNIGEKIPIRYVKDEAEIVANKDTLYPAWLSTITMKRPSRQQLLSKLDCEGPTSVGPTDLKRTRRLIIRDNIRESNFESKSSDL